MEVIRYKSISFEFLLFLKRYNCKGKIAETSILKSFEGLKSALPPPTLAQLSMASENLHENQGFLF
jgi:hypothetical protein